MIKVKEKPSQPTQSLDLTPIPSADIQAKKTQKTTDERVLARAQELISKHGASLSLDYLTSEGILRTVVMDLSPDEMLQASKAPYYRLYLKSGEVIKEHGEKPHSLTYQEQWDLMTDEDKAIMANFGLNPHQQEAA